MHTLPVTEAQLVGSKLISSAVWLLASAVVGVVSPRRHVLCGNGLHQAELQQSVG